MSKSNDEDDPIDELEIGESTVVETSSRHSFWGTTDSDDFCGFDREVSDLTLDDARLVGEEGNEEIALSFSGEVTKVEIPEDVAERRERSTVRKKSDSRIRRISGAAAVVIPFGIALAVAATIPAIEFSINGQTTVFDPTVHLVAPAIAILGLTALIMYGLKGGLPGHNGGLQ